MPNERETAWWAWAMAGVACTALIIVLATGGCGPLTISYHQHDHQHTSYTIQPADGDIADDASSDYQSADEILGELDNELF